jgi:hypothetical protein
LLQVTSDSNFDEEPQFIPLRDQLESLLLSLSPFPVESFTWVTHPITDILSNVDHGKATNIGHVFQDFVHVFHF